MPQRLCLRVGRSCMAVAAARRTRHRTRHARRQVAQAAHSKRFKAEVLKAADHRCQWVEHGERCHSRSMDSGTYGPKAGVCLCAYHHRLAPLRQGLSVSPVR
jgi:hypothetical protein